jgi:hypothetical protein
MPVGIEYFASRSPGDKEGIAAYGLKGTHRAVYPAGNIALRFRKKSL